MSRTILLGDIHGAARALEQVLDRCQLTLDDQLICLGDVCDGWSEVSEVFEILMGLDAKLIRGNHDQGTLHWLDTGRTPRNWEQYGGISTVKSLNALGTEQRSAIREYLTDSPYWLVKGDNLLVHAGLGYAGTDPTRLDPQLLMGDRNMWNRVQQFNTQVLPWHEIFIGHTYSSLTPRKRGNVWNLDTGAGFDGVLTAMDMDTKEFWQSDVVPSLYPNEIGRST